MQMIPTAEAESSNSPTRERALSPALGFAIALVVTVVLAVAVGVLVGTVAEDPEPDADFEWEQTGDSGTLQVTLEHAGGDSIDGGELTLEAGGLRGLGGNTSLEDWGTVRNGSTLTIGLVSDADVEARQPYLSDAQIEGKAINGTDNETGVDVIAVAVEGAPLEQGTVLVSSAEDGEVVDVTLADLRTLRLTWQGRWGSAELSRHAVEP